MTKARININKGMFLESIIQRTIEYYQNKELAFFYKRNLNIKPVNFYERKLVIAKITEKSETDYFGNYNGRYVDFEAKETAKAAFEFKNIKKHQFEHMQKMQLQKAVVFAIIYFDLFDTF